MNEKLASPTSNDRSPAVTEDGATVRTAADVLSSPSRQKAAATVAASNPLDWGSLSNLEKARLYAAEYRRTQGAGIDEMIHKSWLMTLDDEIEQLMRERDEFKTWWERDSRSLSKALNQLSLERACKEDFRAARDRLRAALTSLANEVQGMLGIARHAMRETASNTNVACLERRLREAREALNGSQESAPETFGSPPNKAYAQSLIQQITSHKPRGVHLGAETHEWLRHVVGISSKASGTQVYCPKCGLIHYLTQACPENGEAKL